MSDRIHLEVFGPHHANAGNIIPPIHRVRRRDCTILHLEPSNAELYLAECRLHKDPYHTNLAKHLEAALEHRAQQVAEDIIEEHQTCTPAK